MVVLGKVWSMAFGPARESREKILLAKALAKPSSEKVSTLCPPLAGFPPMGSAPSMMRDPGAVAKDPPAVPVGHEDHFSLQARSVSAMALAKPSSE